jgi:heat shock protein HtpX
LIQNPEANAMAAGWRFGAGALAVTEGALHLLDSDELEGVLAHEIAHLRNRDSSILRLAGSVAQASVWVLSLAAWLALGAALFGAAEPARALALAGMAVVLPLGFRMLQAWLSRSRELAADDTAIELTGRPRALASALLKLRSHSRFWELWRPRSDVPEALRTHPDIGLRVRRLLAQTR